MKTAIIACIALWLYTFTLPAHAFTPTSKYRMTIHLESKVEKDVVSIILNDEQAGVYQHFILEKSLDGKIFTEVSRTNELEGNVGSRIITFKDFPFEKSSIVCVFYRVRAVDHLGWFDFTNTVSVFNKLDIARNPTTKKGMPATEPAEQF